MSLSEIDILVVGLLLPALMGALEQTFRVHKLWLLEDKEQFLQKYSFTIRGIVTSFEHGANAQLMEALPALEIIAHYGVGMEKTDLNAAFSCNINVTNTPDISEPVADLAMTLLLTVARRVGEADRLVRAGKWAQGTFPFSTHIGGKTCGIIGLGRIERAVAKRAEAFGMKIAYCGPHPKPDVYDSLRALARASDFLVLSLPGGNNTKHFIEARILNALGPQGFLINLQAHFKDKQVYTPIV